MEDLALYRNQHSHLRVRGPFPIGSALLIAAIVLSSLALLTVTGRPVLGFVPLALAGVIFAFCSLPVRYSLFALLFVALLVEILPATGLSGSWESPVYPIKVFLFDNLDSVTGIGALRFSGAELILAMLLGVIFCRGLLGVSTDRIDRLPAPNALSASLWIALGTIVLLEIWGLVRGGDFRQSLWQARELFWLPILTWLFCYALRGPRDFAALGYVAVGAAVIKIGIAVFYMLTIALPNNLHPTSVTSHNDSVLFVGVVMLCVAHAVHSRSSRIFVYAGLVSSWILLGMVINGRRIAFLSLFAVLLVFYTLLRGPTKRAIKRCLIYGWPIFFLYLAGSRNRPYGVFKPGQLLMSVVQQQDQSSATRDVENYNLLQTLKQNMLVGSGWGHEYLEVNKANDISKFFSQYRFIAHNSVLWLWSIGGLVGFTLIWLPIGLSVFFARRSYYFARTPAERTAAVAVLGILVSYCIQAWGDMGTQGMTCALLAASAMAVGGKLAIATGAWPRNVPLLATSLRLPVTR